MKDTLCPSDCVVPIDTKKEWSATTKPKKLNYRLLDPLWSKWLVQVLEVGANKYGENTWKTHDRKELEEKMLRHTQEFREGVHIDPEDKTFVLSKIAFHALAILWQIEDERYEKCTDKLLDDIDNSNRNGYQM